MGRAAEEPPTDSASRGRARGPRNMAGKKLFHNSKSWSLMELYNKVLKWAGPLARWLVAARPT